MSPASKPDPYAVDSAAGRQASAGSASAPGLGPAASPQKFDPTFDVVEDRGIHVVTLLRGTMLDARQIEMLGADLTKHFAKKSRPKVVLDMRAVHHLSSSALGILVMLKNSIEGSGGALRLAGVHEDLHKVFKMTKLDKVLTIKDNVSAAKASL